MVEQLGVDIFTDYSVLTMLQNDIDRNTIMKITGLTEGELPYLNGAAKLRALQKDHREPVLLQDVSDGNVDSLITGVFNHGR